MKGFFLERISQSPAIKCAGCVKEGAYVVYDDTVEFLGTENVLKLNSQIEWAVSNSEEVFVILSTGICTIKNMKVSNIVQMDLENVAVKEAWLKNSKIFILVDNEVLIYNIKTQKMHRYNPYGHQIVDMSVDYSKDTEFILLLSSHDGRVVRTIGINSTLEEIGQVSVSKKVYRICSTPNKGFLAVEKERLLLYSDTAQPTGANSSMISNVKSMCFGGPLVRAISILSEDKCALSMLTDEICMLSLSDFVVTGYINANGIISEYIVRNGECAYVYNRRGEMGVLEDGKIRRIRKGSKIKNIKVFEEYGTTPVYALKEEGNGNAIAKIERRRKKTECGRVEIEGAPRQIKSSGSTILVEYKDRMEILFYKEDVKYKESVKVWGDMAVCAVYDKGVYFMSRTGVIGRHEGGSTYEHCMSCSYHKKTDNENEVFITHSHSNHGNIASNGNNNSNNIVVCADMYGSELVFCTVDGVYTWDYLESKVKYLGKYMAISLCIYKHRIIIGEESSTTVLFTKSNASHTLSIAGRRVLPINETEYLLHKYDGSLWCVSGANKYNVHTGSVIIKNILYENNSVLINTINSTIVVHTNRMGVVQAEYIENIGSHGVACFSMENRLIVYSPNKNTHYLVFYALADSKNSHAKESEYVSTDTLYKEDILDFVPLDGCMVILSSKDRKIGTAEDVSLETEQSIYVKLYCGTALLDVVSYDNVYGVHAMRMQSRIVMGVNTMSGFALVLLEVKNDKIAEISRISTESVNILSISRQKSAIYCTTTDGLMIYTVSNSRIKRAQSVVQPVDAKYQISRGHLIECVLSQIKMYGLDAESKLPVNMASVYIDRMKSNHKSLGLFNSEYSLLGYTHEEGGSVSVLHTSDNHCRKLLSVSLPSGVVKIERVSLSLIERSDTLFILTETGDIYRAAIVTDEVISALSLNIAQNNMVLFTSETFVSVESFSDRKASVHASEEVVNALSELL